MKLRLLTIALGLALVAPAAHAKETSKKKNRIQKTGIESFDEVFAEIDAIDDRVRTARKKRKSGRNQVASALGLKKGTPLQDSLAELKELGQGKIQLVLDGTRPTLSASDAVPGNVAAAIDAVNQATRDYSDAITELKAIPSDLKQLNKKVEKFPSQFKDEVGGFKITEWKKRSKQLKKVKNNLKVTKAIPDKSKKLSKGLANDMVLVKDTFKD